MRRIDELFLKHPFYGARQIVRHLRREGVRIGRRRAGRLMRLMGLQAIYRAPRTSEPHPEHRVYPYLLKGLAIERANHVWCADITYIPVRRGFLCLVAILDWASRYVLAWRLSNTLDAGFCVEALEEARTRHGQPEIFNTDQGSQFTGFAFTGRLRAAGVQISMDGRGRFMDNIFIERLWRSLKYEAVVCYERTRGKACGSDASSKMREGPSKSACRSRLQTAPSCAGKEPVVVSLDGKGGARLRQVRVKETNASEPLMTCRNVSKRCRNRDLDFCPATQVGGGLLTGQLASGMKVA